MMNSLIDVTMSDKFTVNYSRECITFTLFAHVSPDDSDDDEITQVINQPITINMPWAMVARGKQGMLDDMEETIERQFGNIFFRSAVDKFKAVVLTKLQNMDLSKYEKLHIEDPESNTYH